MALNFYWVTDIFENLLKKFSYTMYQIYLQLFTPTEAHTDMTRPKDPRWPTAALETEGMYRRLYWNINTDKQQQRRHTVHSTRKDKIFVTFKHWVHSLSFESYSSSCLLEFSCWHHCRKFFLLNQCTQSCLEWGKKFFITFSTPECIH